MEILEHTVLGNTLIQWASALGIVLAIMIGVYLVRAVALRRLSKLVEQTDTFADNAIILALERIQSTLVLIMAVAWGSQVLSLPVDVTVWLSTAGVIAFILQVGFCIDAGIMFWMEHYQARSLASNAMQVTTVRGIGYIARVTILSLLLLLALDHIPGIEVTALLASLGVAGIAVALALQSVLSDMFASLAITFDKPFVINDFINVGEFMGTVENIGVKTTRLRSLSGEQLIFPNADLVNSRIRNYGRMQERRIAFTIGVTYETSYNKLSRIPSLLQAIIEAQEQVRFDRAHFASYGDFALNFEIVYYVLSADYNIYMDVQQAINLAIFHCFEQERIEFAYPTQKMYLANHNGWLPPTTQTPQPALNETNEPMVQPSVSTRLV